MAKVDKEYYAMLQGMQFALKVAKEKGIDGLEDEVKLRSKTNLPLTVSRKAFDECINNIKMNTIDTVIILCAATLHDEFGFGQKRVQQFLDRFDDKAECLCNDYCTWDDYIDVIKEELKLELNIRKNDKNVRC